MPLLLAAAPACHVAQPAATVQLLAINDFHGAIEPPSGQTGVIEGVPAGGIEYLSSHIAHAAAENPNSIVVAAGDLIGAAPPLSSLLHEEPSIAALNAAHLAVSSVGNHEFDKGAEELQRIQAGGCHPVDGCADGRRFSGAAFQYLAANVVRTTASGAHTLFPPTAVRKIGGVKIGFIGVVTSITPRIVRPTGVQGLSFLDEADTANRYAADLKHAGVNAIVLLIHDGGSQSGANAGDPDACNAFRPGETFQTLLQKLTPDIKVVISGHTHQAYNCTIAGRTVTSAASNGRMMTRLSLTIDRRTDTIREVHARNEVVTRDVPRDDTETTILARYAPLVAERTRRIVGSVAATLQRRQNAAGESPLGDVIADAQLAAVRGAGGTAEIAFMNPGGIRADIAADHAESSVPRGQVTFGDLAVCQPFGNVLNTITMSGEALRRLLEQQFHDDGSVLLLQVSSGFTYTYRKNAPPGQHVDPASMMLRGARVLPDARVRVATNDFLLDGGDGFTVFTEAPDRQAYGVDLDALVDYFVMHSPVAPGPANRITVLD